MYVLILYEVYGVLPKIAPKQLSTSTLGLFPETTVYLGCVANNNAIALQLMDLILISYIEHDDKIRST